MTGVTTGLYYDGTREPPTINNEYSSNPSKHLDKKWNTDLVKALKRDFKIIRAIGGDKQSAFWQFVRTDWNWD